MTNKFTAVRQIVGNHGIGWLGTRLAYEVQSRSGLQNWRFRTRSWESNELAHWLRPDVPADPADYAAYRQQHSPRFLFHAAERAAYATALHNVLGESGRQQLVEEADQIRQGNFRYFFKQSGQLGFPPEWHRNPFTSQQTSPSDHWSRIPMFSTETGDLKFIWEPGRFAWAYTLVRAYWVTGDDAYADTFWQLLESWVADNPPNQGAHWRCGQETSLRLMACCFAFYAFADSPMSTPQRLAALVGIIAAQADRVAGDHIYAYLQKNNHAISEGMGLWTVGILFPELTLADKWREAGRKMLEEEVPRQIYDDGAYIQHATNYHRLMLHDYIWAIRLGELNGYELSPVLHDKVRLAGEFLYQLQDTASGRSPNYGSNDGALILPLNGCDYQDFRPITGAIHYLFHQTRLNQPGPWDEDLIWFFGPEALESKQTAVAKRPLQAPIGGYYTLRGENAWAMIRCATYRDRPSQADMLHLDIWRNGVNIACDPGTFLYYAEPPWNDSLVATEVHNTVSVDGFDQMARGPRFMWLTWIESKVFHHFESDNGYLGYFEGAHFGYKHLPQPITHRRAVLKAGEDVWIVVDDLVGQGEHTFRLHWLLADLPYEVDAAQKRVVLSTGSTQYELSLHSCLTPVASEVQYDVVRGSQDTVPRGWQSAYYGVRQPMVSAALNLKATAPCRLVSVFAPVETENRLQVTANQISYESSVQQVVANLLAPDAEGIIQDVQFTHAAGQDHLTIC